ncbi:MAG: BatA and WFA domain-containing protein [Planctomycetota bacterium]
MDTLFRNTLSPAAWAALGAVPLAIFALYFLKLKRQPLEVPSTYLWHRVIEDLHVNSLWQRLRQNLLMYLQLLLVGLAMLSLLRPGWQGDALDGQRFIFLVDNSASMSAADADGGATRLTIAKRRVSELIDQLDSDMSAMIISFGDQPDVIQEFTNNRRLLREALDRIEPTAAATDISGALQLADGFANPGRITLEQGNIEVDVTDQQPVELYILSDGRFPGVTDFSLGNLRPQYLPLGSFETPNAAITGFNSRPSETPGGPTQAFVRVANFSAKEQPLEIELYQGQRLLDAAAVTAPAGGSAGTTLNLPADTEGVLEARLTPPKELDDQLELDNRAFTVAGRTRTRRVLLVTPGNPMIEPALSTEAALKIARVEKIAPDALAQAEYRRDAEAGTHDLIIFDRCAPGAMPLTNTLFVGSVPPADAWRNQAAEEPAGGPQILDWDRAHPLMRLIELGNVAVVESRTVAPPPGGSVLIDSTAGPIFAIAPRDSHEDAVLGFEILRAEDGDAILNTNWPLGRPSYPTFWLNVLEYLTGAERDARSTSHPPGKAVEVRVPATAADLKLTKPDGAVEEVTPGERGVVVVNDTDQLGVYQVSEAGEPVASFAVNLFNRDESDIALRQRTDTGEDGLRQVEKLSIGFIDVEGRAPGSPVRRELWKPLLLAALAVLMLEWYIYNRRVYV